ncbi:hypothetical protein C5B42_03785 [Candidatus Cerribacteria bacterium 'Amazon FNV 2010 28 9']|uniref:Soluble ligand binding domain-containing protein n=1 Tax=Candidatus Cerribacteria bacterium 'Amazon FNV 2010 28 9' TaxID=2081795 RepID=A0A317JNF7_9BACT|nr:MAG: hypothetical protein C5B42_03785 [Candidatus Cerribacteria bacterium 'Amazon FNV 2010 28 9']
MTIISFATFIQFASLECMDEPDISFSQFLSYLKQHPVIPLSLVVAIGAITACGVLLVHPGEISSHSSSSEIVPSQDEVMPSIAPVVKTLTIDIEGAVLHPGVIQLPTSSIAPPRFQDALAKAGGLSANADPQYVQQQLNLAAPLSDGMKIYIPKKGEGAVAGASTSSSPSSAIISINTATLDQLDSLPGIGATRAQAILDHRPYMSLDELSSKAKLPKSIIDKITPLISL